MMTYEFSTDFNDAVPSQPSLIPEGTLAKVKMKVHPGGFGQNGWLTKSGNTGSIYLSTELTVVSGRYAKRKIYHLIGIESAKLTTKTEDVWGSNGRAMIRSILESAWNINPSDKSEKATKIRIISDLGELNDLEFAIKIGIIDDKPYKNTVLSVITPDHKSYQTIMNDNSVDFYNF